MRPGTVTRATYRGRGWVKQQNNVSSFPDYETSEHLISFNSVLLFAKALFIRDGGARMHGQGVL